MPFDTVTLRELTVDDEASFRHVGLYDELKRIVLRDGLAFRVPARTKNAEPAVTWSRALFLNLAFWHAGDSADVLHTRRIPADVVMHVAWHHLARSALGTGAPSAEAMLFGEAIASAFDLYLVGRLLGHAPESEFLQTQVSAMGETLDEAGWDDERFAQWLEALAESPETAFEQLRVLLFDVSTSLLACTSADEALAVFDRVAAHPYAPLLHHYELANWVLYCRAYAGGALGRDEGVRALDAQLAASGDSVAWLERHWVLERSSRVE